jgi:signal transduction histidine kinase
VQLTQKGTAQLAHELKTPLTIIRNNLELGFRSSETGEKQKYFDGALKELDALNGVVEEFLLWARTENLPISAFEVFAISLEKELVLTVEKFRALAPERVKLGRIDPLQIFARPSFVHQIFNNLISNALKYSPEESPVQVELVNGVLRVRDFGSGLPLKVSTSLGEPFNSEETLGKRGTGLGIAWVLTLCRKYGWKIQFLEAKPGLEVVVNFNAVSHADGGKISSKS